MSDLNSFLQLKLSKVPLFPLASRLFNKITSLIFNRYKVLKPL